MADAVENIQAAIDLAEGTKRPLLTDIRGSLALNKPERGTLVRVRLPLATP